MSANVVSGQAWVNARIRELAQCGEPAIQAFNWEAPGTNSSDEDVFIGLTVWVGAEPRVICFRESELAEVEGSPEMELALLKRLQEALDCEQEPPGWIQKSTQAKR